jgi:hypothetical protein
MERRRASMALVRTWETPVVAVIEEIGYAGTAQYIEFKVYRSPTDPDRILASWCFAPHGPSGIVIAESRPGTTVQTEFRYVIDCADQSGIPFVWVNDPDELFPPYERRLQTQP